MLSFVESVILAIFALFKNTIQYVVQPHTHHRPILQSPGITRLQASWRRTIARKKVMFRLQARDEMMAMPGTIRGETGWYELVARQKRLVVKYEKIGEPCSLNGQWKLVFGPVDAACYTEAVRALSLCGKTDVLQGFSLISAVITLQSHIRRQRTRKNILRALGSKMLPMPGTILGESGWYEYMADDEEKMVVYCTAKSEGWEVSAIPMPRRMYHQAVGFAVKNSQANARVSKRRVGIKLPEKSKRRFELGSQRNLAEMARRRITPPRSSPQLLSQARSALLRVQ
jgi:hypothetical protein